MTEDDTFNRLRRRPQHEVYQDLMQILFSTDYLGDRLSLVDKFLKKEKYTWEELTGSRCRRPTID